MNDKQEKALLEFMSAQAHYFVRHYPPGEPSDLTPTLEAARAYLATLEPKPEPKRGVEELIGQAIELHRTGFATIIDARGTRSVGPLLDEALRLYRDERERVERAIEFIHSQPNVAVSILKGRAV